MGAGLIGTILAVALLLGAGTSLAQEAAANPAASAATAGILTLNQDRFFAESAYGKAADAAYQAENAALLAENRRIEAQLEAEERELTERRKTMAPADFAPLAAEFDTRVEEIRGAQDAKSRSIGQRHDDRRRRFFEAAVPVLAQLLSDEGAVAILSNQAVVLSLSAFDITDEAILRVDSLLPADLLDAEPPPDPGQPDLAPADPGEPGPSPELLTDPVAPAP
ncbi:MAG: OmpH family outer membrane protein [Rhodobacteraceae bacterium]|jgi:Skp family chaperone for outer membrane proteins|nr:OmpH family outer membrane protein [Paracoccaceae bacterium]